MAELRARKKPVIQKGVGYTYNPLTFAKEHAMSNFIEVETAQEILDRIRPLCFRGRHFISFDTETHPYYKSSQDLPKEVVRRWVGKGKKAVPQDFPFSIQVCDGINSFILYDSVDNNFAKFRGLAPLFEDASIEKVAHNCKFDMHEMANAGMRIVGRLHDTVVLAKIANENRTSFELRDIAARLPNGIVKFEYMVDSYKAMNKVADYRQIPRELLTQYGGADVHNCLLEFVADYVKLEEENLIPLYDTECEVMMALYAQERYGMKVDASYEEPLKAELQQLTDAAEAAIYEEAGGLFNINSGKQLYGVLMRLGVNKNWISFTDKGNPTLDKKALQTLAEKYNVSIVQKILEYRKYEKLLNTYAVGIYGQRDSEDRVHGNINQTEATTGRMSITKPALQTLPKKDKRIRRAFIPDEGYELWFMDLDQIEYRLFAHYAKIPSLLEAIKNGYDVHAATAAMIFHIELDELLHGIHEHEVLENTLKDCKDPEEAEKLKGLIAVLQRYVDMRSKGKTINFALIYGVGIEHLAELLRCTTTEATELKANYFAQMPEARVFINTVYQVIKQRGFVKNFYGRRRRLDVDDCYKAPNALIQGCAADFIKKRLVLMYKYIMYNNLLSRMNLVVHDECVISLHKTEHKHASILRYLMSDFETFRCPITAGAERGNPSWGQKVTCNDTGFTQPTDNDFENYDVYNGHVFAIYKEA